MPAKFRDYYETLGVSKSASHDEIRSAFRKLARKYHPDVATDKKAAEEKFKEINEAYEVLGDEEKRRKYDELGAGWQDAERGGGPPPGWNQTQWGEPGGVEFEFGGTGFSDFFEQFFGTRRGWSRATGAGGQHPPMRGQDIESDLLVSLEESLHGSTRRISFRRGRTSPPETYTVRIPKGIRANQRIRLAGIGGAGADGGSAGDLFLRVKFERHPDFEVVGDDLVYEFEVAAWDAVLGCEVTVPTLEGAAKLKVPEGSQPGRRFRLSGKGLPAAGGARGDLYAELRVALPAPVGGDAERALWRQIAGLHGSVRP